MNPVKAAEEALSLIGWDCPNVCACGCGQALTPVDRYGRPRKYKPGHNMMWAKGLAVSERVEMESQR